MFDIQINTFHLIVIHYKYIIILHWKVAPLKLVSCQTPTTRLTNRLSLPPRLMEEMTAR